MSSLSETLGKAVAEQMGKQNEQDGAVTQWARCSTRRARENSPTIAASVC